MFLSEGLSLTLIGVLLVDLQLVLFDTPEFRSTYNASLHLLQLDSAAHAPSVVRLVLCVGNEDVAADEFGDALCAEIELHLVNAETPLRHSLLSMHLAEEALDRHRRFVVGPESRDAPAEEGSNNSLNLHRGGELFAVALHADRLDPRNKCAIVLLANGCEERTSEDLD